MNKFLQRFTLSLLIHLPLSLHAQDQIRIDMATDWLRRDWERCEDPTTIHQTNGVVTLQSDHSAALFWQIPTLTGPLPIDRNQSWIKKCDRLPLNFKDKLQKTVRSGQYDLIVPKNHPYVSWRWQVDRTIDDTKTVDKKNKIRKKGDDFAAKLGFTILNQNGTLREIAYLWTRTIPEETILTSKTTIIPFGVLEYKWYRIVAESGEENLNTWVPETRNLYEDFKRCHPGEEPAEIVRIYLMTDSDNTDSQATGSFADLTFHKRAPKGYSYVRSQE